MEDFGQKTILIADDEKEVLTFLTNILRRAGYKVISTTRGSEVLALAQQSPPDLVILDIIMPDLSGDAVASHLMEKPATAKIPVIFLTAILTKEEEGRRGGFGRQFVIAKPATPEKILELVKNALQANPV